jgi:hypothetical protein|tara:strand:+ start:3292 stop:3681 length:390 start_codon:yes stop_codon:yes gene_type:complete
MTELPEKIIGHYENCDHDMEDEDGKGWCFLTLNPTRPCDKCSKVGSYTLDSNSPSYDVAFCIDHIVDDWKEVEKKEYKAVRHTYKSEVIYVEAYSELEAELLAEKADPKDWENTTDERSPNGEIEVEEY